MNTTPISPPCPFIKPADQLARAERVAGAVRFSELAPQKVRWLWPDRIPLGRITLLVSDPGLGKSLLALDIAARVSRGVPWPDEEQGAGSTEQGAKNSTADSPLQAPRSALLHSPLHAPSSVLLLTAEDDFADTVRPRLEALGADCNRILGIATIPGEDPYEVPRNFARDRDVGRLRSLVEALPDCRLIVIDPLSAYLGSSHADIRALLFGLTTLAREQGVAVLIVSHLRKKNGDAIHRMAGNQAFVAASRAAWAIWQDPLDPCKRFFMPVKSNLAPHIGGLAYTIETSADHRAPTIRWSPEPVTQSIDFVLAASRAACRPDEERQHAIKWLTERLTKSPIRASEAREEGEVAGITYATLRRAYREIGGVTVRKGRFPLRYWYWTLPGATAQNWEGLLCAADGSDPFGVDLLFRD